MVGREIFEYGIHYRYCQNDKMNSYQNFPQFRSHMVVNKSLKKGCQSETCIAPFTLTSIACKRTLSLPYFTSFIVKYK